jgi:hypothetical protein
MKWSWRHLATGQAYGVSLLAWVPGRIGADRSAIRYADLRMATYVAEIRVIILGVPVASPRGVRVGNARRRLGGVVVGTGGELFIYYRQQWGGTRTIADHGCG